MRTTTTAAARSNTTRRDAGVPVLAPLGEELSARGVTRPDSPTDVGTDQDVSWQGTRAVRSSRTTPSRRQRSDERLMTKIFKALSDTTRQQILELLEERERNVGEIVCNFNLSQPTISRHLSVLKEADLVVDQRQGQNVIYRLNDETLSSSMLEFFARFACCQAVLR
jgi:DNA-binding transcriptional ArsR family regulator